MITNRLCSCFNKVLQRNKSKALNPKFLPKILLPSIQTQNFYTDRIAFSGEKTKEEEIDISKSRIKQTGKLAKVFAEYGTTAVVFHTTISLTSLGLCYTAVSSGVDVVGLLQKYNMIKEVTTEASIAGGATTFVISYAVHKVFMPVRIFCTVTCTPLIVNKLRQMGLLKKPVKTEQ